MYAFVAWQLYRAPVIDCLGKMSLIGLGLFQAHLLLQENIQEPSENPLNVQSEWLIIPYGK